MCVYAVKSIIAVKNPAARIDVIMLDVFPTAGFYIFKVTVQHMVHRNSMNLRQNTVTQSFDYKKHHLTAGDGNRINTSKIHHVIQKF